MSIDLDFIGPLSMSQAWDEVVFRRNCVAIIIAEDSLESGSTEYMLGEFRRLNDEYRRLRNLYMGF